MPSITTWTRLEPRPRSDDMSASLQARVHDPLWLLARQWQTGEFRGDDAGSPVVARLRGEAALLTTYRPGTDGTAQPYDPATTPLEPLVEAEPRSDLPRHRLAADTGVHLARLLRHHGAGAHVAAFADAYRLDVPDPAEEPDARSLRFRTVMSGRVPDGVAVRAAMERTDAGDLPSQPPVPSGDHDAVLSALQDYVRWFDSRHPAGAADSAWVPERMEHTFAVSARSDGRDVVLAASEYPGGRLDWHHFDVRPGAALPAREATVTLAQTAVPAPVTYVGMPAPRLWEFEDARVHLGAVDAGPGDLAHLVMVEFASVYGNDWFIVPVDVPVGSVSRIASLVVTDTFGGSTLVRPAGDVDSDRGDDGWSMFEMSQVPAGTGTASGTERGMFLPPVLPATALEGPPVEEVHLLRDELDNLVWAVERTVQTSAGVTLDRFEAFQRARGARDAARGEAADGAAAPGLSYLLATDVPDHWVPFVPEEVAPGEMRLRRASPAGATGAGAPVGRILLPEAELVVFEEEVPRAGARVTRSRQHARWFGGSAVLWTGRRKASGRGQGSSGLRFDVVDGAGG